jgi:hypothetical protein
LQSVQRADPSLAFNQSGRLDQGRSARMPTNTHPTAAGCCTLPDLETLAQDVASPQQSLRSNAQASRTSAALLYSSGANTRFNDAEPWRSGNPFSDIEEL